MNREVTIKWTPVTEELPEPSKRYLVSAYWVNDDYVSEPRVYDFVFGTDGNWHGFGYEVVKNPIVTAWAELPEPYKGGINYD